MIIGIAGKMGSGKTLFATKMCYDQYKTYGKKVYSNVKFNFPHQLLSYEDIVDLTNSDLNNAVVLIDEIHLFVDSRTSASKRNRILSYFITQSRKRNIIFIYTSQTFNQVDRRLRENTDYYVLAKGNVAGIFYYEVLDSFSGKKARYLLNGEEVYGLYDTHQIINPLEGVKDDKG